MATPIFGKRPFEARVAQPWLGPWHDLPESLRVVAGKHWEGKGLGSAEFGEFKGLGFSV